MNASKQTTTFKKWSQENAKNTKEADPMRVLRSFAAKSDSAVGDLFDNRLIFGDNLSALKAWNICPLPLRVKCGIKRLPIR